LEVDQGYLQREGNDVEGFINEVKTTALLFAVIADDEILLVGVGQFEDAGLATSAGDEVVDGTLGGGEDEALVGNPTATGYCLVELLDEGEGLLETIF